MEVFVSAALPIVLEKVVSLVGEGHGLMSGVEEWKKLEDILPTIQAVLQDAEEKQLKDNQIRIWLAKLKDAALEAEDILDELHYEVMLRRLEKPARPRKRKVWDFLTSLNPFSNDNMVVKMKQVVARFESIAGERSKFHLTADSSGGGAAAGSQSGTWDPRETDSKINESMVVGRDEDIHKIREVLISEAAGGTRDVSIISIVGVGGLGKTTLAQMVYRDRQVEEVFERKIWVYVSDVFDVPNLLKKIIESATGESCSSENVEVLRKKVTEILKGKKFLLVLDDIWTQEKDEWLKLEISLRDGSQGSCVIVTTRIDRVSSIVNPRYVHRPETLSDHDCWKLFEEIAYSEHSGNNGPSLVEIGRAIVSKCGGLPLAARAMGSLLHGQSAAVWTSVMQSEIWKLKDDHRILPSLRLSYKHLPQHVKPCFAYCAVFPKGRRMDRKTLVELWMVNGFISSDSDSGMEMEQKGHEIFKELISRSLFQGFEEDIYGNMTCGMHDLVHDLARSILGSECHILDNNPRDMSDKQLVRHLSITSDAQLPTITEVVHTSEILRTLLFVNKGCKRSSTSVPKTAQLGTKLRVLDLNRTVTKTFPISICQMKHLRYLDLSVTGIEVIPEAICNLLNLQTLRLIGCVELRKLPEGMGKMRSLRHLYLDDCWKLNCMPRGMGELRCLRTLTKYVVGNEDGSGSIAELKDLDLCGKLVLHGLGNVKNIKEAEAANLCSNQNLRFLCLDWIGSSQTRTSQEVLEALHPPHSLKKLHIEWYPGSRFPTWLMKDSMLCRNLVEINLYNLDNIEEWPGVERSPAFPCLVKLEINNCPRLKTMPSPPSVQELSIAGCPVLRPSKGFFVNMKSLKVLRIGLYSEEFAVLVEEEEEEEGTAMSLQIVEINNCRSRLLSSLSVGLWKNLFSLQELCFFGCDGLVYLPVEVISGLTSLKVLDIVNCQNLVGSTSSGEAVGGLQLQYLTALKRLRLISCPAITRLPELPQSIVEATIGACSNLTSPSEGLGNPSTLAHLTIELCPNLISLPRGLQQHLPTLKTLCIQRCPELERRFRMGGDYCNLISSIPSCKIGQDGRSRS